MVVVRVFFNSLDGLGIFRTLMVTRFYTTGFQNLHGTENPLRELRLCLSINNDRIRADSFFDPVLNVAHVNFPYRKQFSSLEENSVDAAPRFDSAVLTQDSQVSS